MEKEIIKGVSLSLRSAFGDGYEIYQNDVEQGLQEPCFFIGIVSLSRSFLPNGGVVDTVPLEVRYFPQDPADTPAMWEVARRVMDLLEMIPFGEGKLRGQGLRAEIVDGVLHGFATYQVRFLRRREAETMETLTVQQGG